MIVPLIIKGGVIKSINQFYHKKVSHYKTLASRCNKSLVTKQIQRFYRIRKNKILDFLHKSSNIIIRKCLTRDIGTIVIGYNKSWKKNINLGKKTNQNFMFIPFQSLIKQIEYKSKLVGINVLRVSEAYTSQKCSSCKKILKSNRKHRGLYVCNNFGTVLNADVNASINIMEKGVPKSFRIGDRGRLNRPLVLCV